MINYSNFRELSQMHLDNLNENASNGEFSFVSITNNPYAK